MARPLSVDVAVELSLQPLNLTTAPIAAALQKALAKLDTGLTLTPHVELKPSDLSAMTAQFAKAASAGVAKGSLTEVLRSEIAKVSAIGASLGFKQGRLPEDIAHVQKYIEDLPTALGAVSQKKGAPDPRYATAIAEYVKRREEKLGADVPMSEVISAASQITQMPAKLFGGPQGKEGSRRRAIFDQTMTGLVEGQAGLAAGLDVTSPALKQAVDANQRIQEDVKALKAGEFDKKFAARQGAVLTGLEGALQVEQFAFDQKIAPLSPELSQKLQDYKDKKIGELAFTDQERAQVKEQASLAAQLEQTAKAHQNAVGGIPKTRKATGALVDPAVAANEKLAAIDKQIEAVRAPLQYGLDQSSYIQKNRERYKQELLSLKAPEKPGEEWDRIQGEIVRSEEVIRREKAEQARLEKELTQSLKPLQKKRAKAQAMVEKAEEAGPYRTSEQIAPTGLTDVAATARALNEIAGTARTINAPGLTKLAAGFDRLEKSAREAAAAAKSAIAQAEAAGAGEQVLTQAKAKANAAEAFYQRVKSSRTGYDPATTLRQLEQEQRAAVQAEKKGRSATQAASDAATKSANERRFEAERVEPGRRLIEQARLASPTAPFSGIAADAKSAATALDYLKTTSMALRQERKALLQQKTISPEDAAQIKKLEKQIEGLIDTHRELRTAMKAAGGQPPDVLQARYDYGAEVVQRSGGAEKVAKSAGVITDRADLPYAMTYLQARESTLRDQTDVAMAAAKGDKEALKGVAALRKETQMYGDAVRRVNSQLVQHNEVLHYTGQMIRMFLRYGIGYQIFYSVLGAVRALVGGVFQLDAALKSIQAVSQATNDEMRTIETSIKRVAVVTKFSTQEIAKAAQLLGQAGVAAKDFPKVLEGVATFASATESSLEVSADLFTTMRDVFEGMDTTQIANQLTRAVNVSKLTAEELKTILSLSAQTGKSYGLSTEQLLAAAATARNAGIKASTVATGIRQAMLEVFSPDEKLTKILVKRYAELGEKLSAVQVKARFSGFASTEQPLVSAVGELRRLGYGGTAQGQFSRGIDIRAENALKALVSRYEELQANQYKISFGEAAAEGAAIQMEAVANSLKNLGSAIGSVAHDFGKDLLPQLDEVVDALTKMVVKLRDANDEVRRLTGSGLSSTLGWGALSAGMALSRAAPGAGFAQKVIGAGVAGVVGAGATGVAQKQAADAGWGESARTTLSFIVASVVSTLVTKLPDLLRKAGGLFGKAGAWAGGKLLGTATAPANVYSGGAWKPAEKAATGVASKVAGFVSNFGMIGTFVGKWSKLLLGFSWVGMGLILAQWLGVFGWIQEQMKSWIGMAPTDAKAEAKKAARQRSEDAAVIVERKAAEAAASRQAIGAYRPTSKADKYLAREGSVASAFENYVEEAADVESQLQTGLKLRNPDAFLAAKNMLQEMAKAGLDQASPIFKEMASRFRKFLEQNKGDPGITDVQISKLAVAAGKVTAASEGLIEGIINQYVTLQKAMDSGEATDEQKLAYGTLTETLKRAPAAAANAIRTGQKDLVSEEDARGVVTTWLDALKKVDVKAWVAAGAKFNEELIDETAKRLQAVLDEVKEYGATPDALARANKAFADQFAGNAFVSEKAYDVVSKDLQNKLLEATRDGDKAEAEALNARLSLLRTLRSEAVSTTSALQAVDAENAYREASALLVELTSYVKEYPELRQQIAEGKGAGEGGQDIGLAKLVGPFIEPVTDEIQAEYQRSKESYNSLAQAISALSRAVLTLSGKDQENMNAAIAALVTQQTANRADLTAALVKMGVIEEVVSDTGNKGYTIKPGLERAVEATRNVVSETNAANSNQEPDIYVEGEREHALRKHMYEMELLTEQYKTERKWGAALGASQAKYSDELELANGELSRAREEYKKAKDESTDPVKDRNRLQAKQNAIHEKERAVEELQYRSKKDTQSIQEESISGTVQDLEARRKTLKKIVDDMMANPLFSDWGKFDSLSETYRTVMTSLIAATQAEGKLRGQSAEEIQQSIDELVASGRSLAEFADAYDNAAKATEAYLAAFDVLMSPQFVGPQSDKQTVLYRRQMGIEEPVNARLEAYNEKATELDRAYDVAVKRVGEIQQSILKAEAEGTGTTALTLSLKLAQTSLQDIIKQMGETKDTIIAASLDINAALAKGFNVEGIMSDLRATVEDTIGTLSEKIRGLFVGLFEDVSSTLVDAAFGDLEEGLGKSLDKVARDFAKSLAKQVLNAMLQKALFKILEPLGLNKDGKSTRDKTLSAKDMFVTAGKIEINASTVNVNGIGRDLKAIPPPGVAGATSVPDAYVASGKYQNLNLDFAQKVEKMLAGAKEAGFTDARLYSGYRSPTDPEGLASYARHQANPSLGPMAHPANSMHAAGVAGDFVASNQAAFNAWMKDNADKYGLVQRMPVKDPNHIELAGQAGNQPALKAQLEASTQKVPLSTPLVDLKATNVSLTQETGKATPTLPVTEATAAQAAAPVTPSAPSRVVDMGGGNKVEVYGQGQLPAITGITKTDRWGPANGEAVLTSQAVDREEQLLAQSKAGLERYKASGNVDQAEVASWEASIVELTNQVVALRQAMAALAAKADASGVLPGAKVDTPLDLGLPSTTDASKEEKKTEDKPADDLSDALKQTATDVKKSGGGLADSLLDVGSGLLGALKEFPVVGQVMSGIKTAATIFNGDNLGALFGLKAGQGLFARKGMVIGETIRAAGGKVMEAGKRLPSGLIKGIGTGTSDSIPGVVVDNGGKIQSGILVGNQESILNAQATSKLGAPFINWVNKNADKFAAGGLLMPQSSAALSTSFSSTRATSNPVGDSLSQVYNQAALVASKSGASSPKELRLVVSDMALNRTLKDYLESYFADVVATR